MDMVVAALAVPVGLVVGSAVTMVIDRVPDRLTLRSGPRCPHCEGRLRARDLVPVVSWVRLRRRCRDCGQRITSAYPAVEVSTAALFLAGALSFGATWELAPVLVLFAMLVAISVVDLYDYRIPDRIVFPTLAVCLPAIAAVSVGAGRPAAVGWAVVGAFGYAAILLVTALLPGGGMGLGDVKLALVLGAFLGWLGGDLRGTVLLVFVALALGSVLGVVTGLVVGALRTRFGLDILPDPDADPAEMAARPLTRQAFPFGPSLAAAAVVAILFHESLV